jgi:hypothetical protein
VTTPQPPHTSHPPHIDVDTLADLQGGLLEPDRATAVAAHLAEWAECRATHAALDDVSALLREHVAGTAETAPEDVVRRLDEALAAAGPPVATASTTVTALPTRQRTTRGTRVLQAAAVFVLIAAVGALGYGCIKAIGGGSTTADSAASAAGGGKAARESAGDLAAYRISSSGRDYTEATLKAAVPELLAGTLPTVSKRQLDAANSGDVAAPASPTPSVSGGYSADAPPAAPSAGRLLNGTALATCVANLAAGPVTPLAVDLGRFEKQPATIIVLPVPNDAKHVDVFAVAPDCPTGTFLDWVRVARP